MSFHLFLLHSLIGVVWGLKQGFIIVSMRCVNGSQVVLPQTQFENCRWCGDANGLPLLCAFSMGQNINFFPIVVERSLTVNGGVVPTAKNIFLILTETHFFFSLSFWKVANAPHRSLGRSV